MDLGDCGELALLQWSENLAIPLVVAFITPAGGAQKKRRDQVASSGYEEFSDREFIRPPVKRAAYSDRMAFLMAEMSSLAYKPFLDPQEPDQGHEMELDRVIEDIKNADEAEAVSLS